MTLVYGDFTVSTYSPCPHGDCDQWLWTVRSAVRMVAGDFLLIHAGRAADDDELVTKATAALDRAGVSR